jgi:hypothetical protein
MIELKKLPYEIFKQIPISICLNNEVVPIEDLPINIQFLVNQYLNREYTESPPYSPTEIFDARVEFGIFNDFEKITSKKLAVKEYILNYLKVSRGSYPFDPFFGNNLKPHLQTRDTQLRQKLINNELTLLTNVINSSFGSNISIYEVSSTPLNMGGYVNQILQIKFNIEDSIETFEIN